MLPKRASAEGPLEMNQARQTVFALFPPEARLRKVGLETARARLTLTFDFPDRASIRYADIIQQAADSTGWDVVVNPQVNQQALGAAIFEVLPPATRIVKGPSFHLDRREVHIETDTPGDYADVTADYLDLTAFRLVVNNKRGESAGGPTSVSPLPTADQMEINAAYEVIRRALEPVGLYKTSLKQGQIVLSFISPQVGERHTDTIQELSAHTGYALAIHSNPNQQMILQVAGQVMREAGWQIRKGPGIHVDRAELAVTLAQPARSRGDRAGQRHSRGADGVSARGELSIARCAMNEIDDETLSMMAREQMPLEQQQRLSELMDKNSRGTITDREHAELESLVESGQQLMLRKAKAVQELMDRGYGITPGDF